MNSIQIIRATLNISGILRLNESANRVRRPPGTIALVLVTSMKPWSFSMISAVSSWAITPEKILVWILS